MTLTDIIALTYVIVISIVSIILTVYDKIASKSFPKNRIPENTLLYVSIFGGAPAMYLTMLVIRHKTRHKKFMIGLPVIIIIQVILIIVAVYKGLFLV